MAILRLTSVWTRIIKIIGGLSLASALLLASATPGNGAYEVDIYRAYPSLFWILIGITIASGVCTTLIELRFGRRSYVWVYGILLILAANILVFALPVIRDYAHISQRDSVRHLSKTANIIDYGRPDDKNFYPVSHTLAAVFYHMTGMQLEAVNLLFPLLFYLFYITNSAYLGLSARFSPPILGVVLLLASPLLFSSYASQFRPTQFAVLMLPFLVGILLDVHSGGRGWQNTALLILAAIFVALLHPLAFVVVAVLIVALDIRTFWLSRSQPGDQLGTLFGILLILGVFWSSWFMTYYAFIRMVHKYGAMVMKRTASSGTLERYTQAAQKAKLSIGEILLLAINKYGLLFLFLVLAGGVFLWLLAKRRFKFRAYQLALFVVVIIFAGAAGLSLFIDLGTADPARYANFAVVAVPVLAGSIIYKQAIKRRAGRRFLRWTLFGVVLIALFGASILGIFSIFDSPLNGRPNQQYSFSQKAGIAFLLEKALDDNTNFYAVFPTTAIYSAVLNKSEFLDLIAESPRWEPLLVPAHFGYQQSKEATEATEFKNPGYLWVTAYDLAYYTQVWPEGGRLTPVDFERLDADPAWNRVYTSGGITIWRRRTE